MAVRPVLCARRDESHVSTSHIARRTWHRLTSRAEASRAETESLDRQGQSAHRQRDCSRTGRHTGRRGGGAGVPGRGGTTNWWKVELSGAVACSFFERKRPTTHWQSSSSARVRLESLVACSADGSLVERDVACRRCCCHVCGCRYAGGGGASASESSTDTAHRGGRRKRGGGREREKERQTGREEGERAAAGPV
eukprot:2953202-Rhodomonas_salina.1